MKPLSPPVSLTLLAIAYAAAAAILFTSKWPTLNVVFATGVLVGIAVTHVLMATLLVVNND